MNAFKVREPRWTAQEAAEYYVKECFEASRSVDPKTFHGRMVDGQYRGQFKLVDGVRIFDVTWENGCWIISPREV